MTEATLGEFQSPGLKSSCSLHRHSSGTLTMMERSGASLGEDERPPWGELRPLVNCQHQCQTHEWKHHEFSSSVDFSSWGFSTSALLTLASRYFLVVGAVLCPTGCFAASLFSAHWMQIAPTNDVSRHSHCLAQDPCPRWARPREWVWAEPAEELPSQITKSGKMTNCGCFRSVSVEWSVLQE